MFSAVNLMLLPRSYPASPLSPRLPLTASQIIAWASHSAKYGISRLSDVQPHIFIDFIEFQHICSLNIGRSSSKFEQVWMNLNTLQPYISYVLHPFLCSLLPITEGCFSECGIFWEWMCHKQLIQLWPFAGRFSSVQFQSTIHFVFIIS